LLKNGKAFEERLLSSLFRGEEKGEQLLPRGQGGRREKKIDPAVRYIQSAALKKLPRGEETRGEGGV